MSDSVEEQIDIIDENNQVVNTVPKSVAHAEGLLHRIAIAELKNSRGQYCFVCQASDRQDAGQFVSPVGGHVSAGEDIESAMLRESQEEVGIVPQKYKFIGQTIYNRKVIGRKENHYFFVYEIETDEIPVLNHESVDFRWFSIKDIQENLKNNPNLFGAAWHHVFKTLFPSIYQIS